MPWIPVEDDPSGRVTRWVEGLVGLPRTAGVSEIAGGDAAAAVTARPQILAPRDGALGTVEVDSNAFRSVGCGGTCGGADAGRTNDEQDPLDDLEREHERARLRRLRTLKGRSF